MRFMKFVHGVTDSKNKVLKTCGKLILSGSQSSVGKSYNFIMSKYKLNRDLLYDGQFSCISNLIVSSISPVPEETVAFASVIRELCEVRDGFSDSVFDETEANKLIELLCTN